MNNGGCIWCVVLSCWGDTLGRYHSALQDNGACHLRGHRVKRGKALVQLRCRQHAALNACSRDLGFSHAPTSCLLGPSLHRAQTTIGVVKSEHLASRVNAPAERQRIIFRGRALADTVTLRDAGKPRMGHACMSPALHGMAAAQKGFTRCSHLLGAHLHDRKGPVGTVHAWCVLCMMYCLHPENTMLPFSAVLQALRTTTRCT